MATFTNTSKSANATFRHERPKDAALLLESGGYLLQENGGFILLGEGADQFTNTSKSSNATLTNVSKS